MEPRFSEPLFNEVLDITNDIICPGQSYSKMYGIEPRYNEFLDIANIIRKPKRKIYLDITNYIVNTRQKINAEQINSQQLKSFNPYVKETATFQSTAYYDIYIGAIVFRHQLTSALSSLSLISSLNVFTFEGFL